MRLYLIGMPGSGKTTVGRQLARKMGYRFVDLDALLVEAEGMPITDIFAHHGEAYFREAESRVLQQTIQLENTVIATGGGTPCFFENMAWMNEHGTTLFLDIPVETIAYRLHQHEGATQKRPLFAGKSEAEVRLTLSEMRQKRLPYYEKARLRVGLSETGPELIIQKLNQL